MMARMGGSSPSNWYSGWLQATAASASDFASVARINTIDRNQQPALKEHTINSLGFPSRLRVQVGWFATKLGDEYILDPDVFKTEWDKLAINAEAARRFEDAVDIKALEIAARPPEAGADKALEELRPQMCDALHYVNDKVAVMALLQDLGMKEDKIVRYANLAPIAKRQGAAVSRSDGWITRDDFVQWFAMAQEVDYVRQPLRVWKPGAPPMADAHAGKVMMSMQAHEDPSVIEITLSGWRAALFDRVFSVSESIDGLTPPFYDQSEKIVRIPRFSFPKIVGSLAEIFVGSMESGFRFVLQLLASSVVFWPFMYKGAWPGPTFLCPRRFLCLAHLPFVVRRCDENKADRK